MRFNCKGCKNRTVGCHSACEDYIKARTERDRELEEEHKKKDYDHYGYASVARVKRWVHKHRHLALFIIFSISLTFPSKAMCADMTAYQPYNEIITNLSDEDYGLLCKITYGEANPEDLDGNCMVVEVICNRALMGYRGDTTIVGVMSRQGEFSTWKSVNSYQPMQMQLDAVEKARTEVVTSIGQELTAAQQEGLISDSVKPEDYIYFCTPGSYKAVGYKYMHNIILHGGHVFGTQ